MDFDWDESKEFIKIDVVIDYLERLLSIPEEDKFLDIERVDIVNSVGELDFEEDFKICKKVEELVLKIADPELCYELVANVWWVDRPRHEDIVLNSGDVECIYYFATNIDGADTLKHGDAIIKSGDIEYNYLFAKNVEDADVLRHGQVVINSKSVWYNYVFACDVEGADIKSHGQVIIDEKDLYYNYCFATGISGSDVQAHCDVLLASSEKDKYLKKAREEGQYQIFPNLGLVKNKVKNKGSL